MTPGELCIDVGCSATAPITVWDSLAAAIFLLILLVILARDVYVWAKVGAARDEA